MSQRDRPSESRDRTWKPPRLTRLGNVHEWVLESNAFGKYGPAIDGMTSGNNEAMN